ncbi:MAG: hypothetical protein NTV09_13680, partial [Bacteroidetes bacterium]|nr:hypothetical protein [Bacteroidota bacterium]
MIDQIINPFFPGGGPTLGYPEIGIISVPGNCNQFYIVGGGITQLTFIDEHPVPVYVILDMSLPNPNFPGGGYSQFGAFIGGATATVLSNYPNTSAHVNTLQLAVSKLRSNTNYTKRFVFISENSSLYRYDFSASGFSNFTNLGPLPFGNNSNHLKTEMELVDNPSGGYRLAVPAFASGLAVNIFDLDAAGNIITSSYVSIPVATEMKGIEFSPNAQYLYFTCNASPFIGYIDLNAGVPAPVTLGVANATDFKDSEIEIAYDNKMYFASDTRFASLSNTNNPSSTNWTDPATPSLNFGLISSSTYFCKILGDQIDGEDYSHQLHESIVPGSQAFCQSGSTTIIGPAGYSTYHWFQSATNGYSGTQISTSQNLNVSASIQPGPYPSTYYYYLEFENSNGCRGRTNIVSVTINPSPNVTVTIAPSNVICDGETATLSVVSCGGCTYQWYDQNGVIAGATSSTYNTGNAGAYHVTIGNSYGCTGQSGTQVIALIPGCCTVQGATILNNHIVTQYSTENYYGNIVINGLFDMQIGSTVNFNPGCTVTLGANALINVAGATLKIDHATLKACNYMWDGIYLNVAGNQIGSLNITNNSSISDAIRAVNADSYFNFNIQIDHSTFDRNYISLSLHYGDFSGCNFQYNTFSCSAPLNPALAPAIYHQYSYAHAEVLYSPNSFVTFSNNTFLKAEYGIFSDKAMVNVLTSNEFREQGSAGVSAIKTFLYVSDNNNFYNEKFAIYAHDFCEVYVYQNNDFYDCRNGVYAYNYVTTYVDDNTFHRNGTSVGLLSTLMPATITHNRIYDPLVCGVFSLFNTNTDQTISFNNIRNDVYGAAPNNIYGIYLGSNQNNQRTIYIEDNVIINYGYGIVCSMSDFAYLHMNSITLPPNNHTYTNKGIYCEGSDGLELLRNDVTGADASDLYTTGIHIFNCNKVNEFCNNVRTLGNGLLWEGNNNGPNVYGNDMTDCDKELYLLNFPAGLGTQGFPAGGWFGNGIPSDNKWNGSATYNTYSFSSNNPINGGYTEFINKAMPLYYDPVNNGVNVFPYLICTFSNLVNPEPVDICDVIPDVRNLKDDTGEALRIANDTITDTDYEGLKWLSKKYLYELLLEKPQLLANSTLHDAKTQIEQTPIKDFTELNDTIIGTSDTLQTMAVDTSLNVDSVNTVMMNEMAVANSAIQPEKTAEYNLKVINDIILNTIAVGVDMSAVQIATVRYIAGQCPYHSGNAVFTAQNILIKIDSVIADYSHVCDGITMRKAQVVQHTQERKLLGRLYPNPTTGIINFDYTLPEGTKGTILIRDISGRNVQEQQLNSGKNSILLILDKAEAGILYYEL